MRRHGSLRLMLVAAALAGSGWILQASAAPDRPDMSALVARVGKRVAAYYHRAQQLVCLERSTVVPMSSGLDTGGFARIVESELRVELDGTDGEGVSDAHVTRQIRRINGRAPRERDSKDRSGCSDPTPVSPEPLTFLLPEHRDEYRFSSVREGRERDRAELVIEFKSAQGSTRPELMESDSGRDDCFAVKGDIAINGRLWVDAETDEVLRLEEHLAGPTDIRVSWALQRKYHFTPYVTLDRYDFTLHYRQVTFSDPDETVVLPASSDLVEVFRTGLQSTRRMELFSEYQRFLTGVNSIRIK